MKQESEKRSHRSRWESLSVQDYIDYVKLFFPEEFTPAKERLILSSSKQRARSMIYQIVKKKVGKCKGIENYAVKRINEQNMKPGKEPFSDNEWAYAMNGDIIDRPKLVVINDHKITY